MRTAFPGASPMRGIYLESSRRVRVRLLSWRAFSVNFGFLDESNILLLYLSFVPCGTFACLLINNPAINRGVIYLYPTGTGFAPSPGEFFALKTLAEEI
jgi:hypothetical protein